MPVILCSNGKYKIGQNGKCIYDSRAKAERAYQGYLATKRRESMTTTAADIVARVRKRRRKVRKTRTLDMGLKYTMSASKEELVAFVGQAVGRALEKLMPELEKMACDDPGKKRRSKGRGRGLARGRGRGPMGRPYGGR